MKTRWLLVAASVGLLLPAQENKIAPDLLSALEEQPAARAAAKRGPVAEEELDVIVVYRSVVSRTQYDKVARRQARLKEELPEANAALYRIPRSEVRRLAEEADVQEIHPDRQVRGAMDVAAATTGLTTVRSLGFTGKGVGVAIIDSGHNGPFHFTDTTSRSRIVYEQDFTGSGVGAQDEYGHGTHVAGILTSRPVTDGGGGLTLKADMRGVAPGANLIVLKVLDKYGAGKDSNVIAAIDRAIALK